MEVVVVRHHEEDSAGFIGAAFEARGARLSTILFPKEGRLPDLDGVAHIVLLGSTCSVYDEGEARAWIDEELAWLRRADAAGVPVLGICFGAQMLAATFGGTVEHAGSQEIGWVMVDTEDPELIAVDLGMELDGEVPAEPVCLDAQVVAREHGGVGRRQAPVVVELQPRPRRNQLRVRGVDHEPADLGTASVLHHAAKRGGESLCAEADPEHRHPGRVRPAQPGQFLVYPGAGLALVVHRADGPEQHDVCHSA